MELSLYKQPWNHHQHQSLQSQSVHAILCIIYLSCQQKAQLNYQAIVHKHYIVILYTMVYKHYTVILSKKNNIFIKRENYYKKQVFLRS